MEQDHRVAVGFGDDPVPHQRVERHAHGRRQQGACVGFAEPLHGQLGESGQLPVVVGLAYGQDQGHRFGHQPPGDEGQHLPGPVVEPLGVVDETRQRPLLRGPGQQAQYGQAHQEPVGCGSLPQPERDGQGVPLRSGQPVDSVQQGCAQLVEAGERQLHLRLDARDGGGAESGGVGRRVVEERGLADPRFAAYDQDSAGARPCRGQDPLERGQFLLPAPQPELCVDRGHTHGSIFLISRLTWSF